MLKRASPFYEFSITHITWRKTFFVFTVTILWTIQILLYTVSANNLFNLNILHQNFEEFVKNHTDDWKLWRNMIIRMNEDGEVMVSIVVNQFVTDTDKLSDIKRSISEWFKNNTTENVVSLYFQVHGEKWVLTLNLNFTIYIEIMYEQ